MTIRSRCMTVNFDKLTPAQIAEELINRGVDVQEAQRLSVIAGGSFGRALMLRDLGGAELREAALVTLEKIFRAELTNEDIFKRGADIADWSRDKFSDFLTHVQKLLRDICFGEVLEPINSDLVPRLDKIKLPERKIFLMIEAGAQYHRRLKSNASLRLLAEAYLLELRNLR